MLSLIARAAGPLLAKAAGRAVASQAGEGLASRFAGKAVEGKVSNMLSGSQQNNQPSNRQPRQQLYTGSSGPTEQQITAHMSSPGSKY